MEISAKGLRVPDNRRRLRHRAGHRRVFRCGRGSRPCVRRRRGLPRGAAARAARHRQHDRRRRRPRPGCRPLRGGLEAPGRTRRPGQQRRHRRADRGCRKRDSRRMGSDDRGQPQRAILLRAPGRSGAQAGGRRFHHQHLIDERTDGAAAACCLRGVEARRHGLDRELCARELGPDGIRVNAILPGWINNDRNRRVVQAKAAELGITPEAYLQEGLRFVSMRTMIEMSEVAQMALFLSSDAARHVSGQAIGVCGNVEYER